MERIERKWERIRTGIGRGWNASKSMPWMQK
jgi:hypothetical protein